MHVPAKVPLPLVLNTTVPVGVMNVPGEASVTVTVQVVVTPMVAGAVQVSMDVSNLSTCNVAVAFTLGGK